MNRMGLVSGWPCCPSLESCESIREPGHPAAVVASKAQAPARLCLLLLAQMLALINKHYLKDPSSPVKCPLRGSLAPGSQGTEYLIIALNE